MTPSSKSVKLKEKQVNEIAKNILDSKSLMIVSIGGLPSKQFHSIKKSIREHASVQVAKKNIMVRAINEVSSEKKSILPLEKHITADCAFVISNLEGYELAGILASKKTPAYAKAGQIAPGEIEVKAGPTDLVPGPAISELGAFGIQIAVEDGKISIKADRVIASEGDNISGELASLLQKLNIQPFTVGLEPKAVFDVTEEKIYTELKIDPEGYTEELKQASGKALGFARKIVYYCKDTIGYFLAKANSEGEKLNSFSGSEEKEEDKVEKGSEEEKKDDSPAEEVKEEKKEEPAEEVKKEPKEDAQLNNPEESA